MLRGTVESVIDSCKTETRVPARPKGRGALAFPFDGMFPQALQCKPVGLQALSRTSSYGVGMFPAPLVCGLCRTYT